MKRNGFSVRKPHAKRRPTVDPEAVGNDRRILHGILHRYALERIVNMSKTSWKLLNTGFLTVADRGSETVDCLFPRDPKMCLTAIAAIDAAGGKVPIWILCRGTKTRWEQRLRTDDSPNQAIGQGEWRATPGERLDG
jgi:hypothetical protein